jgi:membrane protease subunit HflK
MQKNAPFDLKDFKDFKPPKISSGSILKVVIIFLVLVFLYSSWVTVNPEEVGVILRFGKYTRTVESGLHFKFPFGIETVIKVPVKRQLKLEFGFRTSTPGTRTQYSSKNFQEESLMLTGDLNAAQVEWIVQFRIDDPYKNLFKVRNAVQTFRDINEAMMRKIVGDRTVDEVLTVGRQEVASTVAIKLQELSDQYELGIKVVQVVLQDVNPSPAGARKIN